MFSLEYFNFVLLPFILCSGLLRILLFFELLQVGTIALLSMTGVIVFMLFFLAATFNAIVISLLMSLAAAGGFLALFFAVLTAIYIGALSVAIVVISTAMFSATVAILVVTGTENLTFYLFLESKPKICSVSLPSIG